MITSNFITRLLVIKNKNAILMILTGLSFINFAQAKTEHHLPKSQPEIQFMEDSSITQSKKTIKHRFTSEDDRFIVDQKNAGHNWKEIGETLNRTPRSVRERYKFHISPEAVSQNSRDWTEADHRLLSDLHSEYGPRWVIIGEIMNRNEVNVKNKWRKLQRIPAKRGRKTKQKLCSQNDTKSQFEECISQFEECILSDDFFDCLFSSDCQSMQDEQD